MMKGRITCEKFLWKSNADNAQNIRTVESSTKPEKCSLSRRVM